VEQMKQLTAQLKKDKDGAVQKVSALEQLIASVCSKIQVQQLLVFFQTTTHRSYCNIS